MADADMSTERGALVSEFAGDPDMADLVGLFLEELPERIEAIRAALRSGDSEELQRRVHQLKGAGGGYGFPAISRSAAEVEGPLRAGERDLSVIASRVEALASLCERALPAGSDGRSA